MGFDVDSKTNEKVKDFKIIHTRTFHIDKQQPTEETQDEIPSSGNIYCIVLIVSKIKIKRKSDIHNSVALDLVCSIPEFAAPRVK